MYRTICLITLLSLLMDMQDAGARAAGGQTGSALAPPPTARREQAAATPPPTEEARYYADSFLPLRDDVRAFERDPANRYTYCIRNIATYECLSYASDGTVRRRQHRSTAHGTGFAYKLDGEETRILTNEHVVSWPFVTDAEHSVEDVPHGCKLVSQKLAIVDNDDDEYEADDIPLTRVIDDRALDVAVVRARGKRPLLPYRIGRSSELSAGDVVIVRGFPLGVFQAYNTGKIINTRDEDRFKHWDHTDFIVDAQLSSGNSGSPVLALNRKTGEYELVGVFHASYTRGRSLNAVIAIDQVRDLMLQLKRGTGPKARLLAEPLLEPTQRGRLQAALAGQDFTPFIALGALVVRMHSPGGHAALRDLKAGRGAAHRLPEGTLTRGGAGLRSGAAAARSGRGEVAGRGRDGAAARGRPGAAPQARVAGRRPGLGGELQGEERAGIRSHAHEGAVDPREVHSCHARTRVQGNFAARS